MSSFFKLEKKDTVRILDAGAGVGNLTYSLVLTQLRKKHRPSLIACDTFEFDDECIPALSNTMEFLQERSRRKGIVFESTIHQEDFIDYCTKKKSLNGFLDETYDYCIINPPYQKINKNSKNGKNLRSIGIQANNLYAAFIWLSTLQLKQGGQLVAIVPRSFCNGPLFEHFREHLISRNEIIRLHTFESRKDAFREDKVLQEVVILHIRKGHDQSRINISTSRKNNIKVNTRKINHEEVIIKNKNGYILSIPTSKKSQKTWNEVILLPNTLESLELQAKTGPVVDFRCKKHFCSPNKIDGIPIIYPHHFFGESIKWPIKYKNKPNAIILSDETLKLAVKAGHYVLVKRFSAKEDQRRITATVTSSQSLTHRHYAFENHLNYISQNGEPLPAELAYGVATYLNSKTANDFFEAFSGHTQVNVTDLKFMKFPSKDELYALGKSKLKQLTADSNA